MYIPLKITTDYSILKSLIKVPSLIDFLVKKNINVCGICDDNLSSSLEFYNSAIKNNIKPIIGLEISLNNSNIYLYAKNYDGYKNLLKINTIKQQKELTIADLEEYSNNLILVVPYKYENIYESLDFYKDRYLGYTNDLEKKNALVITADSLYTPNLKALKIDDTKYLEYIDLLKKEEKKDYSANYYQETKEVDNKKIDEFIKKIDLVFPKNEKYIPKYKEDINSVDFLKTLAIKGLTKRCNGNVSEVYKNRLNYELDVINKMGFTDYFLIVYDYVLYAKKNNILVGCRGSAAGSLVSYSIGITDIDPIKYDLLFERFLNPERVTMPDIDIDIDASKREELISYVRSKYGNKKVALGLTYNTLKSKLVLREVGKILNINSDLVDKFVKRIDANLSLKDNLENEYVKKYLNNYKELKKIYDISMHLEGIKKNTSIHAAGVVISSKNLDEIIPVKCENDALVTGITMEYLEDLGLLKMDFLGLKNLTTIANITNALGKAVLKDISLNDEKVLNIFSLGKTEGIFQFETPMMKNLVKKLKPKSFSDLVAAVALGRPGPKDHADAFMKRKDGEEKITYLDKSLEPILKETYGILIYQEQIIAILGKIAGYSYAEADLIRRAISKKKENVIKNEEEKFIKRAINNGYSNSLAKEIYDLIAKFASYGFNKSHSVAYAMVAYQMAYLKTYYPVEFVIELINNGSTDNFNSYLTYLKNKGISLSKPSINNLDLNYKVRDNVLIMPLNTIKNINSEIAKKILEAKKERYEDFFDFCYKTKDFINKNILEVLINADAFREFNINHQTLINTIDSALNYANLQDNEGLIEKPMIIEFPEYSSDFLREKELDSYGFYITNHPSSKYNHKDITKLNNIDKYLFKKIKCVVLIEKIKNIKTKKNEDMAFISVSDETSTEDFTCFPKNYNLLKNIKENDLVEIYGEVSKRFDKVNIIINNIKKVG